MQAARPKVLISPLQTGLGVALHHLTGSRYHVEHLHRPEFSSSYSEIKPFFNYLLRSVYRAGRQPSKQLDSVHWQQHGSPGQNTRRCWNIPWDGHSEHWMGLERSIGWAFRTLDGAGTFHGMGIQNTGWGWNIPWDGHSKHWMVLGHSMG